MQRCAGTKEFFFLLKAYLEAFMKTPLKILITCFICIGLNGFLLYGDEKGEQEKVEEARQRIAKKDTAIYPFSQKGNFEIGGVAGMPSGINSRWWIVDIFGIDFTLGSTIRRDFVFTADFLFEHVTLTRSKDLHLRFFYGVGGLFGYDYQDKEIFTNVRIPVGLSMPFTQYPFTLSLFAAPALVITPKIRFDVNWGIAARYNFGGVSKILARERSLKAKLSEAQEKYGALKDTLDATKNELDKTAGDLDKTKGELDTTKGKLHATKEELDKTSSNLMKATDDLDGTKSELSNIRNNLDSTVNELSDTKGKLSSAKDQLLGMKKELQSTKTELAVTRDQLTQAKKKLDDREIELLGKQKELDNVRNTIKEKLAGEAKQAAEKKVAKKQAELNKEFEEFKKQKETWEKEHAKQKKNREKQTAECAARRGIINEDGYCDCREHEQWNSDRSACVCVKGYSLNRATDRCEPCDLVNIYGVCAAACGGDEKKVLSGKGPNKYICVKKCSKKNEAWSDRKNACVCKDGYSRDEKGECVPRK
jgi:uncharacterized coiled-coil DUF342 family protein